MSAYFNKYLQLLFIETKINLFTILKKGKYRDQVDRN